MLYFYLQVGWIYKTGPSFSSPLDLEAEVWSRGLGFRRLCYQLQSQCWCFSLEGLGVYLECPGRYLTLSPPPAATGIRKKEHSIFIISEQREMCVEKFERIQIIQSFLQGPVQALLCIPQLPLSYSVNSTLRYNAYSVPSSAENSQGSCFFSAFPYLSHWRTQKTMVMQFKREKFSPAELSMNPSATYQLQKKSLIIVCHLFIHLKIK